MGKNVCIATWWDSSCEGYAKYTSKLNRRYCRKHGYTFRRFSKNLATARDAKRHNGIPHYQKIYVLAKLLRNPKWSHVVWIDADAAFRPSAPSLSPFLTRKAITMSMDIPASVFNRYGVNSGVVILKSCTLSRTLVKEWRSLRGPSHPWHDMITCRRVLQRSKYSKSLRIVKYGKLQNIGPSRAPAPIVHLAGRSNQERRLFFSTLSSSRR